MIRAFYSGTTGAIQYQYAIDVVANNLANVNTTGYDAKRPQFQDLLYRNIIRPQTDEPDDVRVGAGVRMANTAASVRQGALNTSGRDLDFAIAGEGYFAIQDPEGGIFYTRDGSFYLSVEQVELSAAEADELKERGGVVNEVDGVLYAERATLVNGDGYFVLNDELEPITFDRPLDYYTIKGPNAEGERDVEVVLEEGLQEGDDPILSETVHIGVFRFTNPYALNSVGNNLLQENDVSGEAMLFQGGRVARNFLEASTVYMADELTQLITNQRAFQLNARVIQTADELEQTTNGLRA